MTLSPSIERFPSLALTCPKATISIFKNGRVGIIESMNLLGRRKGGAVKGDFPGVKMPHEMEQVNNHGKFSCNGRAFF